MGSHAHGPLKFGMLGPLEVLRAGEPVRLGGERQRALLALLLVHANELVTVDQLIDGLFGEQRSDSAVNAMRVAVSRLRRTLENGDSDDVLRTAPGGYVLRTDFGQLDVALFERLLADGQQLLVVGDHRSAAARLRAGLALWRGPALADLSLLEFLQPEIRRLEELHLLAVMERIDADLGLEAAGELIGELELLVASNPLQERLRGQLMRALYRAGRQADALSVYRQTGELMRGELGLEPSRSLRQLEQAILRQDASLDAQHPPANQPRLSLPATATPFVGRARELAEVSALLHDAQARMLTLTGAGGTGKTRLALQVAAACAGEYRDGVSFVGLADLTDAELVPSTICQALEITEQPGTTPRQRLKEHLKTREMLLLLDNLEQLSDSATMVADLVARCPGVTLLITSREPVHLTGERQYEVSGLAPADAVELFMARARAISAHQRIDPEIAGRVCERVDFLPLAVELAAARTKALSLAEILSRLDERLPLLTGGPRDAPRRQRTLRATIDWSHDLLNGQQQTLFARLAVFAGGFALPAADAVCGAHLDTLQALVDRSLVRHDGERYRMLQTIREYALERLQERGETGAMRAAHARWLVELLEAEELVPPGWPTEKAARRVAPERENFREALEWTSEIGDVHTLARLASALVGVWVTGGQLHESKRWLVLALQAESEHDDRLAAQVLSAARALARHETDYEAVASYAQRALVLWRRLGDTHSIAREMLGVGIAEHARGDAADGRRTLEETIQFARDHGADAVLGAALNALGHLATSEGDLREARTLCEESLSISPPGSVPACIALINLAHIAILEGDDTTAARLARESIENALRRSDMIAVAWATTKIAWSLANQGALERSARALGAGLEFMVRAGAGIDAEDAAAQAAVRAVLRMHYDTATADALIDDGRTLSLEGVARELLGLSARDD